jgi:two-component system sensor histidine kinase ChvG
MLLGGVLYLESYRERLIDVRRSEVRGQAQLIAMAVASDSLEQARIDIADFGRVTGSRLRLYGPPPQRRLLVDSWTTTGPNIQLKRTADLPFRKRVAQAIDVVIEGLTGAPALPDFPDLNRPPRAWPSLAKAKPGVPVDRLWRAPDRSLIITASALVPGRDTAIHMIVNARDITFAVRDERLHSFQLFLGVLAATLALSTFLARTIAAPLQALAAAAAQVRAGRAREVVVPTLPERRDEIGQLARALAEMTAALRQKIDATEAFAADVAHELKNPLASLRSALETYDRIDGEALRRELRELMSDDVRRMTRLLSAIAEASRLDAEMSRARFSPVDLVALAREVAEHTELARGVTIETPPGGPAALGDADRLAQIVRNLIDNAVTFSPDGGTIRVEVVPDGQRSVVLMVSDEGPGIPPEMMGRIFERFYSSRPKDEAFAMHSGLGLAIVRAIAEAHGGQVFVENLPAGGARFSVRLPRA